MTPSGRRNPTAAPTTRPSTLVLGCGALARELLELVDRNGLGDAVDVRCLPAQLHNRPEEIALDRYGVERLPGAHCYAFYAGLAAFDAIAAEEPGTFYLTDFLARSFDALVVKGLGLDRHPELLATYFWGYRRVVYLSQHEDPALLAMAEQAAERLGLAFEHRPTGYGELATAIEQLADQPKTTTTTKTTTKTPTEEAAA